MFLTLYFTTYLSWPDWLYFYCFFSVLNILTHSTIMLPVGSLHRFTAKCTVLIRFIHFVDSIKAGSEKDQSSVESSKLY